MAEAIKGFTITKLNIPNSSLHPSKTNSYSCSRRLRQFSISKPFSGWPQLGGQMTNKRACSSTKVNALQDYFMHLMAVMVQIAPDGRDVITYKSIVHPSDAAMKNVYIFYIMYTCWGCLFFSSMKDPFYDSEDYRGQGGDGSGNWSYTKQEDMEQAARAELFREELIEEIEQNVGGLRELEEAGRK